MTADAVGGVWQYALDLADDLALYDVRVTLAVLGPAPRADQVAAAHRVPGCRLVLTGLPLDWTADAPGEVAAAGEAVAALAVRHGADLVHLNSPALAAQARFLAPAIGVCHSCVATWWQASGIGPLPWDLAWRRDLVKRGCRALDRLIAPTAAFAQATARTYDLRDPPIVVRNGRRQPQKAEGSAPGPVFAFTAGRLWDKGKNLATLDHAAARLDIPVLAAGSQTGPNNEFITLNAVRPLGELHDEAVRERLAARPIFVSVARYEPFGLAVLEAAQAGCALVLSDIPTFRELWDAAAAFVPVDDEAAIAEAIGRLAADPAERSRLGEAARGRAASYTVEAMAAGVMAAYRSVLPPLAATLEEAAA
jgi:glycosyltransferase involved in cell wall biosynthesis